VSDIPHFAYPGGKARHAKRIISLFPPVGDRFVDVFAGRGNLTWAVMSLLNYRRYWVNALGTHHFFIGVAFCGGLPDLTESLIQSRTVDYYDKSKAETLRAFLNGAIEQYVAIGREDIADHHRDLLASSTDKELDSPIWAPVEGYVSRDGGTYKSTGPKGSGGGITKEGFRRNLNQAGLLWRQNHKRTKLTQLDYREVLAQCTKHDMVYL
jgi:hypothetical protein